VLQKKEGYSIMQLLNEPLFFNMAANQMPQTSWGKVMTISLGSDSWEGSDRDSSSLLPDAQSSARKLEGWSDLVHKVWIGTFLYSQIWGLN
jgi:hypothetical protein